MQAYLAIYTSSQEAEAPTAAQTLQGGTRHIRPPRTESPDKSIIYAWTYLEISLSVLGMARR